MSGLPYLLHTIVGVGGGQLADWLRSRGILTTGQTRKVSLTAGNFLSLGSAKCLLISIKTVEVQNSSAKFNNKY